ATAPWGGRIAEGSKSAEGARARMANMLEAAGPSETNPLEQNFGSLPEKIALKIFSIGLILNKALKSIADLEHALSAQKRSLIKPCFLKLVVIQPDFTISVEDCSGAEAPAILDNMLHNEIYKIEVQITHITSH
ncbi:hypothetical protein ACJX0J_007316, partial [Zea mays]